MADLIGIDPGAYSVKVVGGRMSGPLFSMTHLTAIDVDPSDDREQAICQEIALAAHDARKLKGKARIGITGRDLMIRYTTVPPVPLWRLRLLMDFEVQEMASQAGDGLTADYNLLDSSESSDETVLVSLVKDRFLNARLGAWEQKGMPPIHAATPNCIALFNSFLAFGRMEDDEYTFLLDIGDQNLEMAIQRNGELLYARNVSGGGHAFSDAIASAWGVGTLKARELKHDLGTVAPQGRGGYASANEEKVANAITGAAGQLAGMIQATIAFSRSQSGLKDMQVGRVVISGGGSELRGLPEYLEQSLGMPVRCFQPDAGLDTSSLSPEQAELFEAHPSTFAVALGLARMSSDEGAFLIDLVPPSVKKKRRFMQRTAYLIAAAVVAAACLGGIWMDMKGELAAVEKGRRQARSNERQAVAVRRRFTATVDEAVNLKERVDKLSWESRPGTWFLRAQGMVQSDAPDAVWVQSVEVARKRVPHPFEADEKKKAMLEKVVVVVKGSISKDVKQTLNEFVERLRKQPGTPYISIENAPQGPGDAFEIMIDFAGWPNSDAAEEGDDS